jgi:hypothetical protein
MERTSNIERRISSTENNRKEYKNSVCYGKSFDFVERLMRSLYHPIPTTDEIDKLEKLKGDEK